MTNTQKLIGVALVIVGFAVGYGIAGSKDNTGGVYNTIQKYFPEGLYAGKANQFSVSSLGNLAITPAAGATSTVSVGCIQTYATSSNTAVKVAFNTQATTSINGTINGVMLWKYGTCP